MSQTYQTRPGVPVKAEQFLQNERWPDVVRHLPDGLHPKGYIAYLDAADQRDEFVPIRDADWIVTGPNGRAIVLPDYAFRALFEKVEP